MSWSRTGQRISCDEDVFFHDGPTGTDPSHDCAHLLVAANGGMLWMPGSKERCSVSPCPDDVRVAEYNASVLEHFLDETFNCGALRAIRPDSILVNAIKYAIWFVDEHFKPFPMSAMEALESFCSKIDHAAIVRLSPHFFRMKRSERREARAFRGGQIEISFEREDVPVVDDEIVRLQTLLQNQLPLLKAA